MSPVLWASGAAVKTKRAQKRNPLGFDATFCRIATDSLGAFGKREVYVPGQHMFVQQ